MAKILVVEDDWSLADMTARGLRESGHEVTVAGTLDDGLRQIEESVPDLVITDLMLDDKSGLDMLRHARDLPQPPEVILITAHPTALTAAQAMQGGAYEYLTKPYSLAELNAIIERVCARRSLVAAATPMSGASGKRELIAESAAMQETLALADEAAASASTVLLRGESGVGKEEVAMFIHSRSPRANEPFIAINCGAMPESLLASELFGHEKGAFTGANAKRQGRFEQADGGTLFLDEIGDMPAETQTRLLRVLADGEFYRVGGHTPVKVDVRIIAATHQDLESLVQKGDFREDLFHRLNVIRIHIPKLSERREDIPRLMRYFFQRAAEELGGEPRVLLPETETFLTGLEWPGNVRQLENTCRWITVMASGREIHLSDLPPELGKPAEPVAEERQSDWRDQLSRWAQNQLVQGKHHILRQATPAFERAMIEVALQHSQGRKRDAAELLGWGRNTLTRKMKELGM